MLDWRNCPAVEQHPKKVSGAWLFRGTRIPITALFENLEAGASIDDFIEWFPGVTRDQVVAVMRFIAATLSDTQSDDKDNEWNTNHT